jgi:hypothetical protein
MNTTTDQRERALEALPLLNDFCTCNDDTCVLCVVTAKVEAALTAPPHVPQDTLSEVREALAFYANKKTTTQEIYMEGGKAAIKALATLDRFIEGDGWLPIESAPRDGTYVLLYSPLAADNGRPDCTYMVDKWQKNLSVDGFRTCNPFHWPYTHWRPLPTPPEDE